MNKDILEIENKNWASVALPGSKTANSSDIYVSNLLPMVLDNVPSTQPQCPFDAFLSSCNKFPDRHMVGKRKTFISNGNKIESYEWQTYSDVLVQVEEFGLGLSGLLSSESSKMYGLCSRSRPEWLIADLAGQGYGLVSVTLFVGHESEALSHIFKETEISVLVCDLESIGQFISNSKRLPTLKTLVCMDELSEVDSQVDHLRLWAKEKGINILDMNQVRKLGIKLGGSMVSSLRKPIPPEDLLSVVYTSGTTDLPKGVMLGGKQFAACIFSLSVCYPVKRNMNFYRMEFLPYARVYFRSRAYFAISRGQALGFYSGLEEEPEKKYQLLEDICILGPNLLPMDSSAVVVLRSAIREHLSTLNPLLQDLFEALLEKKVNELNEKFKEDKKPIKVLDDNIKRLVDHPWSEYVVFGPARRMLGGNINVIAQGGRSLPKEDIDFLRVVLGAHVVQAYGATETCGEGFSTTSGGSFLKGFVGGVAPLMQAKLVDCPELEYAVSDKPYPRGEVWLKGPSLFQGYYSTSKSKEKSKKKEVLQDGWYPTGDIAALDPLRGEFAIIDRKVNFFKVGENTYITPDKLEKAYQKLTIVSEIYVPTEKGRSGAVAIIYPEPREFIDWVSYHFQKPMALSDFNSLCDDVEVLTAFCSAINQLVSQSKQLSDPELLQAVHLESTSFKANKELVTSNKKLKRNNLRKKYTSSIEALYQRIESGGKRNSSKSNSNSVTNKESSRDVSKSKL